MFIYQNSVETVHIDFLSIMTFFLSPIKGPCKQSLLHKY